MADEPEVTEPESAPSNAELDAKVDTLADKLDQLVAMFGRDRDKAHGAAQAHTEDRLSEPTTAADEIRRQLDERDRASEAKKAGEAEQEWRRGVDQTLSELTEKAPEPPRRKIESIMGWADK